MHFIFFALFCIFITLCLSQKSIDILDNHGIDNIKRRKKTSNEFHVLVLGGAGFVGFSMIQKLSRLHWITSIICVDELTPYYPIRLKYDRIDRLQKIPKIRFEQANISDPDVLKRVFDTIALDSVVYLANYPIDLERCRKLEHKNRVDSSYAFLNTFNIITQYYKDQSDFSNNINGNSSIIYPNIVYISSSFTYAQMRNYEYLQNHPLNLHLSEIATSISRHLPLNEAIAQVFHLKFGISSVGFRIPSSATVYGPGNPSASWMRTSIAHTNVRRELYDSDVILSGDIIGRFKCDISSSTLDSARGSSYKTLIYIEDLVDAMILSLNQSQSPMVSQSNVMERLRLVEMQPPIKIPASNAINFLQDLKNLNKSFTNYRFNHLTNVKNARLNFSPILNTSSSALIETYQAQVTFNRGMKETINWYQHYTARLWPCASECHNSTLCHATHWDKLILLTKILTYGCPVVIYTIGTFEASHLPDIEAVYSVKDPTNKRCLIAFIDSKSYLIQVMKAAQGVGYGNWTMIETELESEYDYLPKFSPTGFFSKSVKYAFYIDSGFISIKGNPLNAMKYFHTKFHQRIDKDDTESSSLLRRRRAVQVVLRYSDKPVENAFQLGSNYLFGYYDKLTDWQLQYYRKYGELFNIKYRNFYNPHFILHSLHSNTVGRPYRCRLYQEILHWGGKSEIFSASYAIETSHRIVKPLDKLEDPEREWIGIGKNRQGDIEHIRILPKNILVFQ